MRSGSVQSAVPCWREETSFSGRFLGHDRVGKVRMACWTDSGLVPYQGQVVSGFLSNQEGWAAR